MRVEVRPYQPVWAEQFQAIKVKLERVRKSVAYSRIEHVGSTSVPGLVAKPVIDVDIIVKREALPRATEALQLATYRYLGEMGIPDRHVFKAPDKTAAQNVYVCVEGSQGLRDHLLVRDTCRQDPAIRDLYGQKLELSKLEWASVDDYCMAKKDVLAWILSVSGGMTADEVADIRARNAIS